MSVLQSTMGLYSLLEASDDDESMRIFVRDFLDPERGVAYEDLRRARAVIYAACAAIALGGEERWNLVRLLYEQIRPHEEPPQAPAPSVAHAAPPPGPARPSPWLAHARAEPSFFAQPLPSAQPEPAPPPPSAQPAPAPAAPRRSLEPVALLGATAPADQRPSGPALPFVDGAPSPSVVQPSPPSAPRRSLEPVASLGATTAADETARGPALPFGAAATEKASDPMAELDRYARICAEIATQPEARIEVVARHGFAEWGNYERFAASWWERFGKEPSLETEWRTRFERYRKELGATRA